MGSKVIINNIEVDFPYPHPYDLQVNYMKVVMDCLEKKKHGVLESPTGTGKTLCLFAPLSAWLRQKKLKERIESLQNDSMGPESWVSMFKKGKVWYTARTHSQIAQTVSEVRKCNIDGLSIRVMGARDQLCVNPDVANEKESFVKTVKCKELVKARLCRFHRALDYEKHAPMFYHAGEVADIEDLVSTGKKCGVCPYYMARIAKDQADVVLLPYNYIIDGDSRDSSGGSYEGDIVIFDEGHNVPNTCEESFEFTFTTADIVLGVKSTQELMEGLLKCAETASDDEEKEYFEYTKDAMLIMEILKKMEEQFKNIQVSETQYSVDVLYSFFNQAGLTIAAAPQFQSAVGSFISNSIKLGISGSMLSTLHMLEKVVQVLHGDAMRSFSTEVVAKSFKFVVSEDSDYGQYNSKKLSLFCFNPSFGIKDILLLGVQSLIITSGTLSPLGSFIHELNLPDPLTLENKHIAKQAQIPFMILGTGVNNIQMDASFKNRKEISFMTSLGMTLTNLIVSIPDGVLLLFSSYSVMQDLKNCWEKDDRIWNRLNNIKRVFLEPRGKEDFINCMENYRRAIDSGNGAVLMGVVRGKISEGMDFKDQYCRGVFIVGVPFPPVMDPRVKGKEKYVETLTITNPKNNQIEKVYKNAFIAVEAMKATNQAIGRVIRHVNDYGTIVLVDHRFTKPYLFSNISGWLRGAYPREVNFMTAKKTLGEFFRNVHFGKLGVPEIRKQNVTPNGEPIASTVQYEQYDHKTAIRKYTSAPSIGVEGSGSTYKRQQHRKLRLSPHGKNTTIAYFDDEPESSSDILEMYKNAKTSNAPFVEIEPSVKTLPNEEMDIEENGVSNQHLSPSLIPSTSKANKRKRPTVRPFSPTETMSTDEPPLSKLHDTAQKEQRKEIYKLYFNKVRASISKEKWLKFKSIVTKYLQDLIVFNDITDTLKDVFPSKDLEELLLGFKAVVRKTDNEKWNLFLQQWRENNAT